jgi:hypothetical protein
MARESDDAGPTLLVISIVVLVLVLTTTALRITVRTKRHALGGDDYTIAVASLLAIGRVTCQIISVSHGNGKHREFIANQDYEYINFLTWLTQLFLFPILCLLKISVCLLVLRIKSTKTLRYCLWSLVTLLVLTTLLPDIVLLAECDPDLLHIPSDLYVDRSGRPRFDSPLTTSHSCFCLRRRRLYITSHCCCMELDAFRPKQNCRLRSHELGCSVSLACLHTAILATTNTYLSSTIFACVRASSLGLAVSDLSWVYCWAAIWGNIELGFGILGAVSAILLDHLQPHPQDHPTNEPPLPEPRPLPHLLGLLQTRHLHHHLQNPLHRQQQHAPQRPTPERQQRPRLKLLRPTLPRQIQTQQKLLAPHVRQHPHAQLLQIAHLGRLT